MRIPRYVQLQGRRRISNQYILLCLLIIAVVFIINYQNEMMLQLKHHRRISLVPPSKLASHGNDHTGEKFVYNNTYDAIAVLLHGKYRTGSTFASKFFSESRDVMYVFEPLRFSTAKDEANVTLKLQMLDDIFRCKLNTSEAMTHHMASHRKHMFCKQRASRCDLSRGFGGAEDFCATSRIRVQKVIRVDRLRWVEDLIRRGVKIIGLIRDPRAVYVSRHTTDSSYHDDDMKKYCDAIIHDASFIRELQRKHPDISVNAFHHVLRYEDLAVNPLETTKQLYRFIGVEPDSHVNSYANFIQDSSRSSTHTFRFLNYRAGARNAVYTAQAWRLTIPWTKVLEIQEYCGDAMKLAGYKTFWSPTEMTNLNISVFVNATSLSRLLVETPGTVLDKEMPEF